jgi:NAD(P)-dependent dehydrogenase (short-subunit alcohol dehydrogenase family)
VRLEAKTAIVVGAGQRPGETIGNGRAAALLFAREGARILAVDRDADSAAETAALITAEGGEASPFTADVRREHDCAAAVTAALERWGRIDVLHNNVGIGSGDGDAQHLEEAAWDRIFEVNLKGMWLMCRHAVPSMRDQGGGAIVNVSSIAAVCAAPLLAYKVSKAGVNALTHQLAMDNARFGVRVNAVMPGLIDTPMAVDGIADAFGIDRDEVRSSRDRLVPLGRRQGSAWDVAHAALFLASEEAGFITGAVLPVDGGQSGRIG